MSMNQAFDRRAFLKIAAATGVASLPGFAFAQGEKLKIGLMLPYTGTFAQLGVAITNGFKLAVAENGGKLGGRELEYFTVDDESDPAKATDNANKLVTRDKVDVLIGTVHSGVAMAMVQDRARDRHAAASSPTRARCGHRRHVRAEYFSHVVQQLAARLSDGQSAGRPRHQEGRHPHLELRRRHRIDQRLQGRLHQGGRQGGEGTVLPFPSVEFQPLLTEIASIKPDAVFVFFAGGGAVKFVKDWQAAGLKARSALYGSGFLTDGILEAAGDAAEGIETTLHYGDGIETPKNKTFRLNYAKTYKLQPDVYAVQGYDAGLLLAAGLKAVKGDMSKKKELYAAMEKAKIDSPRGAWTMSKAHNPIQDIYLRKVVGKENKVTGVAYKALADPARGCKMG